MTKILKADKWHKYTDVEKVKKFLAYFKGFSG